MVVYSGSCCCVPSRADCCGAVARTIVCMERSYVTAAFFRHRTYERYRALQQQQQAARLLGEGAPTLHAATVWCVIPSCVCQDHSVACLASHASMWPYPHWRRL